MAISYKILGQAAPANNTNVTVYTVPTGKQAILSSITFVPGDGGGSMRIHAVKVGATAGNGVNTIYKLDGPVSSGTNYQFSDKITLSAGEFIAINHSTSGESSSVITIFGTEMDI
jgi:predicted metal-dependent enzyme (double-stranded beta helix superfamily)